MHTICVVQGEENLRQSICSFLHESGLRVWGVASIEDFYVRLLQEKADLVVVDLDAPDESGLHLLRWLSAHGVPTVALTARSDLVSRIAGLDAGALQCFGLPVSLLELAAGIRSQLRYRAQQGPPSERWLQWQLDRSAARLIAPNQQSVSLTSRELELLGCLMTTPGALVPKRVLIETVGADQAENGFHRIESQLTRLRRKTQASTGLGLPVRAVFGKGLVFVGI